MMNQESHPRHGKARLTSTKKIVDPLDQRQDLKVNAHVGRANPTDILSLEDVTFGLSRVEKKKTGKKTKRVVKEIAAATVLSVEKKSDTRVEIDLQFCAIKSGEPVEFEHKIKVTASSQSNLDDYRRHVETGQINPIRLMTEFKFLLREIGKESFTRLRATLIKNQEKK